ncbi:TonB-dependent siderophore receptor [Pusillimonas caeni]|uniref:TonB-dependent siderophore receptor n=1 Tax=Pusillimonas caeni TaxID=1348472 RepID=UPI001FD7AF5B|nr:TonB-dependent siderophore receptor [Pusillimonas caeni]
MVNEHIARTRKVAAAHRAGGMPSALTALALSVAIAFAATPESARSQTQPQATAQGRTQAEGQAPQQAQAEPAAQPQGSPTQLDTVVVTANQLGEITEGSGSYTPGAIATSTRLVLTPRETPQSISVVTRQQMDDFNLTSIDDVMEHTPGISIVTYDSERTEYYARGFAIQNFQYDGIPMTRNSAYSAGNTLSDTAIYDRIEVLKGATGLLTGSGTPGATINLIRKKPTREFSGHLSVGAGRWEDYRGELDMGGPLNESGTLRARGVVAYQDRNSYLDRYGRKTSVFYGILEADLTPDTLLTLGFDYQDNKPKASTWGGIPLLDSNGNFNDMPRSFNNGADFSHWDQYTRTAFVTLEHAFANDWVAKAQFNHQINGYDANLGAAASGFPNPADGSGVSMWIGQYIGETKSDAFDAYLSGPFSLAGREHELVLGASVSESRWTNDGYWNAPGYDVNVPDYYQWQGKVPAPPWPGGPDYTDDETTRERGLYAAARWNLRDDLKLITGGRWATYRNRVQGMDESGVFVPYLGVVYDVNDIWSVYASYTSIFSPQSLQDEQGNTLDPLEGNNYEAGVKAAFLGGRLNASAAVFQLEQDNFGIETGGTTPSGGVAYRAAQGVKTKGFELEVSGRLTPAWQISAGYTHNISRQDGERVSTLTPSNQFSLFTSYKLGGRLSGLTLGAGARWQDKTWGMISAPGGQTVKHTVDDLLLVDLMARYDFTKQLSGSIKISNLFDKKYYTIFSWYSTYTWGEPRNIMANLRYQF